MGTQVARLEIAFLLGDMLSCIDKSWIKELSLLNAKPFRLRGGTGFWDKWEVTLWPRESLGRVLPGAEHARYLTE